MTLIILVYLRSQDQLIRHGFMDFFIPLLLIIAADNIHQLPDPADPFHLFCYIPDFRIVCLIHKLLDIRDFGKIHLAFSLKMRIHGTGHRTAYI